jgi:hypothetical protein
MKTTVQRLTPAGWGRTEVRIYYLIQQYCIRERDTIFETLPKIMLLKTTSIKTEWLISSNTIWTAKIFAIIIYCWIFPEITKAQKTDWQYVWKSPMEFSNQSGLPDPFIKYDGLRVQSREEWPKQREYIKAMLTHYQYGKMPPTPDQTVVTKLLSESIFDEMATKKLYKLTIRRNGQSMDMLFGLIKPNGKGPFPIIIKNDRADLILDSSTDHESIPEKVLIDALNRGYIYCIFNRWDLGSDVRGKLDENRNNGVFTLYPEYNWGTIAVWAWGYQLLIDYFEELEFIDTKKIIVTGHSRGGKAAFAAGIFDDRIAITAPNSSGLGGTSSHLYYEIVASPQQHIVDNMISFPHWWSEEYYKLVGFESRIPFDAHFGKIAIAPRAFFNTHAYQDYWANPFGAWLTLKAAKKVYKWLGVDNNIAMHFRAGEHAHNKIDWYALLDFCDYHFYNQPGRTSQYGINYRFNTVNPYPWANIPLNWDVPDK